MSIPNKELSNGVLMPQLGLGVYKAKAGDEVENAVKTALEIGYRHIDTAAVYRNEESVGKAINESSVPREEIFVTTKLWNSDQGYDSAIKAYEASLERLEMDYVDLYLIHWWRGDSSIESWRALEQLYADGRVKAIGVSNFQVSHLERLIGSSKVTPMVNQIELHPMLTQTELRKYGAEHNIQIESWSPIMQGGDILNNEHILQIANKHNKSAAQVVLRWHIQSDLVVIPKSVTPERIKSNFELFDFELSEEDMSAIDNMNQDKRVGPHPDNVTF